MAQADIAAPEDRFRLSQLLSDSRYRSITLQALAAILLALFFVWLVDNTLTNLDNLNKTFSFDFLGKVAGYDINQTLISYDGGTSTHLRAAMIGLLNTLLVAFAGCLAATFIGLIVGIARLSSNKPLARLARLFVEIFRNVPLLLWLLLIFAALSGLPSPGAFRGENATAQMYLWDSVGDHQPRHISAQRQLCEGRGSLGAAVGDCGWRSGDHGAASLGRPSPERDGNPAVDGASLHRRMGRSSGRRRRLGAAERVVS